MDGSKPFSVTKQELGHIFWISLLFGAAAAIERFVVLGSALQWGDLQQLWLVAAGALAWVVKRYLTETRPPAVMAAQRMQAARRRSPN